MTELSLLRYATHFTSQTLVGYMGDFPRPRGNCFSVAVTVEHDVVEDTLGPAQSEHEFRILNFGAENLEELVRIGALTWPIRIAILPHKRALIHDTRIPHEWYSELCGCCTPDDMMPLTYRLKNARDLETGIRKEKVISGGLKMVMHDLHTANAWKCKLCGVVFDQPTGHDCQTKAGDWELVKREQPRIIMAPWTVRCKTDLDVRSKS